MVEWSKNKKHIAAIHQEKELLTQKLSELSTNYDQLKTSNDTLNEKLMVETGKNSHPSRQKGKNSETTLMLKSISINGKSEP